MCRPCAGPWDCAIIAFKEDTASRGSQTLNKSVIRKVKCARAFRYRMEPDPGGQRGPSRGKVI